MEIQIAEIITILITIGGGLLGYGKLKEKVETVDAAQKKHEANSDKELESVKSDLAFKISENKADLEKQILTQKENTEKQILTNKEQDAAARQEIRDDFNRFEIRIETKLDKIMDILMTPRDK